ncbi:MAG TPA: wax ester/triacylglycerol synthase family O-acyltransferase [Acidimicrobiales bacterium]
MRQLSGVDVSFLNMETPSTFGHVSSLNIFDPTGAPGGAGYEATRALILERLEILGPFRRRLREVPLGLDNPYWVDDPHFDIDFHVRHHAIPSPGTNEQLAEAVCRIIARPLDRSRPLWELYVIEGLEGGLVAQLTKVHHATIDGVSGAKMLAALLDTDPEVRPSGDVWQWTPEPEPTDAELLRLTALEYLRRPEKLVRLNVRMLRELAFTTRSRGVRALADLAAQPLPGPVGQMMRDRLRGGNEVDEVPALPPTPAPRTPFNRSISAHRKLAFTTLALDDVKGVKNKLGCTLNDVIMGLCSGTLRRYLESHAALPDEPLIALVPVSIRTGDEDETYQNRVWFMLANLATNEKDPVERVLKIRGAMNAAKEMKDAMPAEVLTDFTKFAPPALAARVMRLYSRTKIADRMNPPFNLIISNVPGPAYPLYSAGARLEHFYPVSALADGQGLNMTVQSYNGSLDFGFLACRELVPDVAAMNGMLRDSLQELIDAV